MPACHVCREPMTSDPPSGVCSERCLRRGQGFPEPAPEVASDPLAGLSREHLLAVVAFWRQSSEHHRDAAAALARQLALQTAHAASLADTIRRANARLGIQ